MQSKVTVNLKKNRIVLTFKGAVSKSDADSLYTDIRFAAADLRAGFDVISDYSECKLAHITSVPTLRKMTNFLIEKGAGEAVRIVGKTNIINKQMLNYATRIPGYKPITASTLEEAELKLADAVRRDGLRIHFHGLPVEYIVDGDVKKGDVENISVSGCAISSEEDIPGKNKVIRMLFAYQKSGSPVQQIEITGEVVRVHEKSFAVHFIDMEPAVKKELFAYILYETQRD